MAKSLTEADLVIMQDDYYSEPSEDWLDKLMSITGPVLDLAFSKSMSSSSSLATAGEAGAAGSAVGEAGAAGSAAAGAIVAVSAIEDLKQAYDEGKARKARDQKNILSLIDTSTNQYDDIIKNGIDYGLENKKFSKYDQEIISKYKKAKGELDFQMAKGYMEKNRTNMKEQTEWLEGPEAKILQKTYYLEGKYQADLEAAHDRSFRETMSNLANIPELQTALAENDLDTVHTLLTISGVNTELDYSASLEKYNDNELRKKIVPTLENDSVQKNIPSILTEKDMDGYYEYNNDRLILEYESKSYRDKYEKTKVSPSRKNRQ